MLAFFIMGLFQLVGWLQEWTKYGPNPAYLIQANAHKGQIRLHNQALNNAVVFLLTAVTAGYSLMFLNPQQQGTNLGVRQYFCVHSHSTFPISADTLRLPKRLVFVNV